MLPHGICIRDTSPAPAIFPDILIDGYRQNKDRLMDYFDEDLTKLLKKYFRKKPDPGFQVFRIMVQLIGTESGRSAKTKEE